MGAVEAEASKEVYLLPLNDDGAPDVPDHYIYLPPPKRESPYIVRFAIGGASSVCRSGSLWVNVPATGERFQRDKYREFKLNPDFQRTIEIDIPITTPGSYAFYLTYQALPEFSTIKTQATEAKRTPLYYIDVSPKLTLQGQPLPLDALSIFSLLSKFMGKYPKDWEGHLTGIGDREYNMIHFTPLMVRGQSNSPYSLEDQLKFDPLCFANGEKDIVSLLESMEKRNGLLAMTDVVWNHTAHSSKWLEEHPEAGYNVETAPWLESALELDTAFLKYSENLGTLGLPTTMKNIDDLLKVMDGIKTHVIGAIRLWEYYVVNVEENARAAVASWQKGEISIPSDGFGASDISDVKNWPLKRQADFLLENGFSSKSQMGARFSRKVDPKVAAALLTTHFGGFDTQNRGAQSSGAALSTITRVLDELNLPFYREYDADTGEILEQTFNRVKYVRLDDHGPKAGAITKDSPLVEPYFTRLPLNEMTKKHNPKSLALVNNGWIWAADAMRDNAGPDSKAYLRREVIVWGDCVKLRYGKGPEDNPFLWDYMSRYTKLTAKFFHGLRIDNCHSTPIHVAEYLLDQARQVRPNLAIFAELFTGSEQMDYVFVKRLGLSALIREAMQAWSTQELSRLVHRHGGRPIGSFEINEIEGTGEVVKKIKRSPLHALFMDCTHDNEVPAQKRDARDTLPNAALVNMCACATGSVMGYDEIYPKLVDLVNETRLYSDMRGIQGDIGGSEKGMGVLQGDIGVYENGMGVLQGDIKTDEKGMGGEKGDIGGGRNGIGGIKKLLNHIHVLMGKHEYDETHIHHEGEFITVHRLHPLTRKGYFLIAHTAFPGYGNATGGLRPVHLSGTKVTPIGCWMLEVDATDATKSRIFSDKSHLRGLPSTITGLKGVEIEENEAETIISIPKKFPPGSIALFETSIPSAEHSDGLDKFVTSGANEAFGGLGLKDLNFILYRCDSEERDMSQGQDGVYSIPNYGALVYAGLQGWWSVLRDVIRNNDLGHPICNHLRDGQWALDYIIGRLEKLIREGCSALERPTAWLTSRFNAVRRIPSFLLPRYFALIVQTAYSAAWRRTIALMSNDIQQSQPFLQQLAMVSVQQTGLTRSASLWPDKYVPSLAAGLPHFSSSWARCWGRDVFISLRGLYLGTGRYHDAKEHILAFGSVLKHGMIPNLLGSGKGPRYNSRDSVWFFLQNIQDYTKMVPGGMSIMKETTARRFLPYDDTYFDFDDQRAYSKHSTIDEIVQEVMQRHADGISFREANAGSNLDMQMKMEGFQIDIHVDWSNGMIFGGNQDNCGTWMDKMGESEKAGSKGVPGTPRDGAAVEITGMLYSTLIWLEQLAKEGKYIQQGVRVDSKEISWGTWASKIKKNFERCYFIPLDPKENKDFDVDPQIINRRGIFKDLYRSGKPYEDYQLRPNFPIAMAVAPGLFTPSRALTALAAADKYLLGPTGMATLDPSDLNYRPYYNNSEDSHDFATSKGRNYHQGPEWLWPTGFFLRALLKFDLVRCKSKEERVEAMQQVTKRLKGCKQAISESPWAGLTELTNKGGSFCADSVSSILRLSITC